MVHGYIIYEGPSTIDGKPIVALANGFLSGRPNRKTGQAIQTYIIRSDVDPSQAAAADKDVSVCGICPLRPKYSGVCYVEIGKGVKWTWDSWKRGNYRPLDPSAFAGWFLRLGTYGDPAAVPLEYWQPIINAATAWAGYTHQWRYCDQQFRSICMASVDSIAELRDAQSMGWRTYRVRHHEEALHAGEIICPASDEGGFRLTCSDCKACRGSGHGHASVAILAHGRPWKMAQFGRLKMV